MKNKNLVIVLLFISMLIAGVFYWFQFRPTQIRTKCDAEARAKVKDIIAGQMAIKIYDPVYEACLHREGLK